MKPLSPKAVEFIDAIIALSQSYGYSLAHESADCSFILQPYNPINDEWLREAYESL